MKRKSKLIKTIFGDNFFSENDIYNLYERQSNLKRCIYDIQIPIYDYCKVLDKENMH